MKKIAALLLSAVMLISLCACAKKDEEMVLTDSALIENTEGALEGGWTRAGSPAITGDIKKLTDKAFEDMDGCEYIPVAYIGSQVVAGTNHAILCRTAPVYPDAVETWAIVYLYEDLEGNVEILDVADFGRETNLSDDMSGSWQQAKDPAVDSELKATLDKAFEFMTGASYEPVALLAEQVVAGTNYCVLCEQTATVPGAEKTYAIVYVYKDLDGNAEVTDIAEPHDGIDAEQQEEDMPMMQIANPFVDYDSLEDAAAAVGFELTAPESIEGFSEKIIQVMDNSMIQVIYISGDDRLFIRKQAGSGDISGDYNEYAENSGMEVGEIVVSMKGDDGKVSNAVWENGGYTYAVMFDTPVPADTVADIVAGVK